jgi:glycosyltransferase involved in cell wall biosynthesis
MSEIRISAALISRNESMNISDAVNSLSFADQIVVADTGSSDDTIKLAEEAGAEVHSVNFEGFGNTKNKALEFCRGEWVLFIDADERVTPELARQVLEATNGNSTAAGFNINRLTYFLGKPIRHSGWNPDPVLRLFKKNQGRFSSNLVHEKVEVDGQVENLEGNLVHYSYKSVDQYLDKMQEYSSLSAREMLAAGRRSRISDFIFRPVFIFLKMYFFKAGFLDGFNGLLLASLSSYHVFIKYLKLRQLRENQ